MLQLNLPSYEYKLKENSGKLQIFDPIRKKYIILTPEEWVRQHVIHLLNNVLGYPASRTNVEGGLSYNKKLKRTDILVYSDEMSPLVLVECKAPDVAINQKVIDQLTVYNSRLNTPLLISTNGMQTYAILCKKGDNAQMLQQIPTYQDLKQML